MARNGLLAVDLGGWAFYAWFIGGCYVLITGYHLVRHTLERYRTEAVAISACHQVTTGRCKVVGRAVPVREAFAAPISAARGVWFAWEVESFYRVNGKFHEKTEGEGATAAPFWVVDETGRVLVRPRGAQVRTSSPLRLRLGDGKGPRYSIGELRRWSLIGEDRIERARSLADPVLGRAVRHRRFHAAAPDLICNLDDEGGRVTERSIASDQERRRGQSHGQAGRARPRTGCGRR